MMDEDNETISRLERRKARTHRRVLEEAERLFRAKGFDATTVEEIAWAADVAKGTFFNYFESKESLLGELLYRRLHALLTSPPAPEAPADQRIRLLLQTILHELTPYRHLSRQMFAHAIAHPKPEYLPHNQPTATRALAQLVQEGQAQGVFRHDINPDLAGGLLVTYFFRLCVLEFIENEKGSLVETTTCANGHIEEGLDLLYRGMFTSGE